MKLAGMFLLLAGWGIVVSAIVLFPHPLPRAVFVLAGLCLQIIGLGLAFRPSGKIWEEAE